MFENQCILQSGIHKSGNLYLYNILSSILKLKGVKKRSFISDYSEFIQKYNVQTPENIFPFDVLTFEHKKAKIKIYRNSDIELDDLNSYITSNTHIWTHAQLEESYKDELKNFGKIVYVVRDPRDRAISNSHWVFANTRSKDLGLPSLAKNQKDFLKKHLLKDTVGWGLHVINHLKLADELNIHFIFYENLIQNFEAEIYQLCKYLEIPISEEEVMAVKESVSFSNMKKKNPEHVRKGSTSGWREELSSFQNRQVTYALKPLLDAFGYPLDSNEPINAPSIDLDNMKNLDLDSIQERLMRIDKRYLFFKNIYKKLK